MITTLQERFGLDVGSLPRQLDLTAAVSIRAWITPNLEHLPQPPQWPADLFTRFRRIAVVESPACYRTGKRSGRSFSSCSGCWRCCPFMALRSNP